MSNNEDSEKSAQPETNAADASQPGSEETTPTGETQTPGQQVGSDQYGYQQQSQWGYQQQTQQNPWTPPADSWNQQSQQSQGQSQDPYSQGQYGSYGYGQWTGAAGSGTQSTGVEYGKSSSGGSGAFKWLIVAVVAALIGAIFGAGAAVVAGDDDGPVVSSLTKASQEISSPATPINIRSVLEKVQPTVVSISVRETSRLGTTSGTGTGMIISSDGVILTNAHVVADASQISVTLNGKKESIPAKLLGSDRSIDSAVIKVDAKDLPTVDFGDSDQIQVGDQVVAIGNALALAGGPSVTTGIVSAKGRDISDGTTALTNLLQTDAAINPGNSGGPLVNMAGQVVGMNTAVIRGDTGEFQNIGFALAINNIKPAIEDIKSGKQKQQALLGVSAVTLDDDIRQRYEIVPEKGAVIDTVTRESPADAAGLQRLDVITELDGKEITSNESLTAQVRSHSPGDKVKIVYYRDKDKKETTATLAARPPSL